MCQNGMTQLVNEPKCTATSLDSVNMAASDHTLLKGKHKPYISEAFQISKEPMEALEKAVNDCKNKIQDDIKQVIQKVTKLEENKHTILRDIDNHVQVMIRKIKENEDKIKNEVETLYEQRKVFLDVKMHELQASLDFLNLQSNESTARQLSRTTALKERIDELSKTLPNDDRKINFVKNQCEFDNIGNIQYLRTADYLKLQGMESVTQGQTIVFKIIKTDECKIHVNQLKATWTLPTGEINIIQIEEDNNRHYLVTVNCTSSGVCKLDVSADDTPINQSPQLIKVEKEGLVNTIKINEEYIKDLIKCEDDCLLVSCLTNEMLKYKQSGEYIGKVTLPQGVKVNRMFKMKNGNIAFSDFNARCIKVCNKNGLVTKSIGQEKSMKTSGMYIDETSNVAYVGGCKTGSVFMFDIDSGQMIRSIGSRGIQKGQMMGIRNVTITNQRHLLVLEFENNRLQLFDNEGRFIKVLVEAGDENGKVRCPRGVVVDEDDNIIISSNHKLQLFSGDGNFIKRIDKPEDGINDPCGLSIISVYPRRLAVANSGEQNIKIFNY
ncbi:E3 ubiquitin-protein ligase TRIM71-like isoform X2 [Anneissia japonica]|uniref:E3 ubiquitin-protein ligase TRIM71-like isoform X2 n=1 Tax=Anneissia japonica TaxID=1529436 RepID=UPI0014255C7B|nr:E3 ubiquitin-protein ligase TRIM71-like isoform X2 [Anneissia japonica]